MFFSTRMTVGAAIFFAYSATALGQSGPEQPEDQIIVTGARTPISISRIGNATTVITRDQIEARQARYVSELLRGVPGFSVSSAGAIGAQTQVRVRGAEANHVLVLIDGVRANDPATSDEFRWEHLSVANVERIEIVRGPQSALWGSDAVAAVVHIITRNSDPGSRFESYVESGSNGTSNGSLAGRYGTEKWSMDAAVERLDTDGTNISRTGAERDAADLVTASLGFNADFSDALSVFTSLRSADGYSAFDPVDFVVTGLPTDGDVATDSRSFQATAGGVITGPAEKLTHRITARYYDSEYRNLVDGIRTSSSASNRVTAAYQADIALDDSRLSLAVEHERTEFEQRGEIEFGDPNQDQAMNATAVVAEYLYLGGQRFSWLASGRYDDNSDFEAAFTGRLAVTYRVSDATSLRAAVGTAQKSPTFTERFGFFPGQFVGNPSLEPEKSASVEIGADHAFAGTGLRLQMSFYLQNLDDEINGFVFDPETFLATAENMSGDSRRSGAEVAASWDIADRWQATASYSYTDSSFDDGLTGRLREIRRPRHTGNLSVGYRSTGDGLQVRLAADYGGTQLDQFFPPWPEPPATVLLSNYWLVDLTAQLRVTDHLTAFARGSNLLDESYEQVYGYATAGRAGYVGLRLRFGD